MRALAEQPLQPWMLLLIRPPTSSLQGNEPTAFSVLTQALTGQMAFVDADYCATCGDRGADKKCSLCKSVSQYFSSPSWFEGLSLKEALCSSNLPLLHARLGVLKAT